MSNILKKTKNHWLFLTVIVLGLSFLLPACMCAPAPIILNDEDTEANGNIERAEGGLIRFSDGRIVKELKDGRIVNYEGLWPNWDAGNLSDSNSNTSDGNGNISDGNGNTSDGNGNNSDGNGNTSDGNGNNSDGNTNHCIDGTIISVLSSRCATLKAYCVKGQYICVQKVGFTNGHFTIGGKESFLQGVVYNPVPPCKPSQYDFTDQETYRKRDFPLLRSLGGVGTTLRMLREITDRKFLDDAHKYGLRVIAAFSVRWDHDFINSCGVLRSKIKARVQFYRYHPAIVAYSIGEEVALHIANSNLTNKENRIKAWFVCLNQLAGDIRAIEGNLSRPIGTVSGTNTKERIGDPTVKGDEKSLTNIDFYMFNVYQGVEIRSWLRGTQRAKFHKPVVISAYGIDACRYNASSKSCTEDQRTQALGLITLARDVRSGYDDLVNRRIAGGIVMGYSDEWWRDTSNTDICHQNADGYPHGLFPDGYLNSEWFGLVKQSINTFAVVKRKAYGELLNLWRGVNPWKTTTNRSIMITSHKTNTSVRRQVLLSGTFSGFRKKAGEDWANLFLLVRPFTGADHYPMAPISLAYGAGAQTWIIAAYIGRKQDIGKKFELIPAYTTTKAAYNRVVKLSYFINKPVGLILLKNRSIVVIRK